MSIVIEFSLPKITCINCVRYVKKTLTNWQTYPILYDFNIFNKTVRFEVDAPESIRANVVVTLQSVFQQHGIVSVVIQPKTNLPTTSALKHWLLGGLGIAAGAAIMLISWLLMPLPFVWLCILASISIALTLWIGKPSLLNAITHWRKTRLLTMDSLFFISTFIAIAVSIIAIFIPVLPMMFDAGLFIFGFRRLGLAIEHAFTHKLELTKQFQDRIASIVRVQRADQWTNAAISSIQPGEIISIPAGAVIPLDGVCINNNHTWIHDSLHTGKTSQRQIQAQDPLLAGMTVALTSSPVQICVKHKFNDSYLCKLDHKTLRANSIKAPIEMVADRILRYFIPIVLGIAVISGIVVSAIFSPLLAIRCAISVLVVAFPCTLGMIVPLAIRLGLRKAAERSIIFKTAKSFQAASTIDAVVFDLNGTLTHGTPEVTAMTILDKTIDHAELANIIQQLEQDNEHAVAQAIQRYLSIASPIKASNQILSKRTIHKTGVIAEDDNATWAIGNSTFMQACIHDQAVIHALEQQNPDKSLIFCARNNTIVAYFSLQDSLRHDAKETLEAIHNMGKKIYLCTGADRSTALIYAKQLNIAEQNVFADCPPFSNLTQQSQQTNHNLQNKLFVKKPINPGKAEIITALKQRHPKGVAMVGDGGNDSLALSNSDLGIAVTSLNSDEMTQHEASVIVSNSGLKAVQDTFQIANQTIRHIKQNLGFSLIYNILALSISSGLLLSFGVLLSPGVCALLMILQTVLILANSLRFKQQASDTTPTEPPKMIKNPTINLIQEPTITQDKPYYGPLFAVKDQQPPALLTQPSVQF